MLRLGSTTAIAPSSYSSSSPKRHGSTPHAAATRSNRVSAILDEDDDEAPVGRTVEGGSGPFALVAGNPTGLALALRLPLPHLLIDFVGYCDLRLRTSIRARLSK